jgi:Domain of unknown function (DUF4190)
MATTPDTPTREAERAAPMDRPAAPAATTGRRSGRATASMILGIISIPAAILPIIGLVVSIVGLVLGFIARRDIDRRGLTNRGQAVAGIVLSSIGLVLTIANMVAGAILATS